jgi:glucosylceramidase
MSNMVQVYQTSRNAGPNGMPDHLATEPALTVGGAPPSGKTTITVDLSTRKQTIQGFGAALTEATASLVLGLPDAQKQQIMDAYWGPNGSNYTLGRTHIGSCDFALSQYSYDDNGGQPDPSLANFSIDHDKAILLPFIKSVISATGGSLKLLSSPWSPPGWMKDNGSMQGSGSDGSLLQQYYGTYAEYLSKYIQAYKAEGVNVWAITPQNEAVGVGGSREGMQWQPADMNNFLKNNLGPTFQTDGVGDTKVFVFDHNKGDPGSYLVNWANTILGDSATLPFIAGTAVHWYDSTYLTYETGLETVHGLAPNKDILFDEGCDDALGDTGYGQSSAGFKYSWMSDEFYWTKDEGDWGYWFLKPPDQNNHPKYEPVYRYARDLINGLNHWYIGFIDWNAVLNKDGGPGHIVNAVASPIMVDTDSNTVYMSPTYYVLQHVSKFFQPGAVVATTTVNLASGVNATDYDGMPTQDGNAIIAASAQNPDNSIAVVLFNETNAPIDYAAVIGTQSVSTTIPAQSLQTLVWK